MGFSNQFVDLGITAKTNMKTAFKNVYKKNFGGTDCSLPMQYALRNNIGVDTFIVVTDNETWDGVSYSYWSRGNSTGLKPDASLRKYRKATGIDAKLMVIGMTATEFTIADPKDRGMMDVVGFDASTPRLVSDFSNGVI
jgi:60 kDa SS-A/Ro ribonucleoprotein